MTEVEARAYIDKTFGLAFFVPPPILANWRKYLLDQLTKAFPEHDQSDLMAVRDLFSFARPPSAASITPREMKLFVNGLVVLYRQRGGDIALPAMAAYLLHKDDIVGMEIGDNFLSARERRVIETPNWRASIAALHFAVSPDEAAQLLLQEPILASLQEGSPQKLRNEENRPGFFDVLGQVILGELEKSQKADAISLAQIAGTIGGLEGASKPLLQNVWKDLRNHLRSVSGWDEFKTSPAEGIKAILAHTLEADKPSVCTAVSNSLSQAQVPELEGDHQMPNAAATNWLNTVVVVLNAVANPETFNISIPGSAKFKLDVLQQLAEFDTTPTMKSAIKPGGGNDDISNVIVSEIDNGRFLRVPAVFVSFLAETLRLPVSWASIVKAGSTRLRVPDVNAKECHSLTVLLLCTSTIAQYPKALDAVKDLSTQGHLSHLLQQHRKNSESQAALVAAILLANPKFERLNQIEQSAGGDGVFSGLIAAPSFDGALITAIANFIISVRAAGRLLEIGAQNPSIARLVAAILGAIAKSTSQLDTEPQAIVDNKDYLEKHEGLISTKDFVGHLSNAKGLFDLLASQTFDVNRCHLYLATLEGAEKSSNEAYLAFLEQGIAELAEPEWERALNSASGPHFNLVELCSGLRQLGRNFELSTSTRDAVLAHVRKVASEKNAVSDEARERLEKVLGIVQKSQRASLIRDIVDDMSGSTDPASIPRIIEFVGEHVNLDGLSDVDRIVRRIFTPLVNSPNERTADWMLKVVEGRLEFFKKLPVESREEFGLRLRNALHDRDSLSESLVKCLTKVADLLEIDLSTPEQNTIESASNPKT